MLRKVLIANRGEIAVRIVRACQELGLDTVAVYSDADRMAPHVRRAQEAYHIGPAPAAESYLCIDRIIDVAKRSGADGVHPGYGFLSESPDFAQAVLDAGLIWIGPPIEAIRLMGDKAAARRTMAAAGAPIVPGTQEHLSDEELVAAADRIGYPLLVKAAAGGGGKGMRGVYQRQDLLDCMRAARYEAQAAFGDDRIYLEKLVSGARHIEVQVLADTFGNVIHLGERECSIQRRHQKLIEEAPSPAVSDQLRAEMGRVAVKAARAAGYVSAGTVEFLLDQNQAYYFLEMNTRLQVEHPVTEMVTGVDIVKEMLRVAAGRQLRYTQDDIRLSGWAIECRILAEDPYRNFIPSTGKIASLWEPTGPGVRLESGVYPGVEVTPYYDSLIAKLVTWGETRGEAILRMRRALAEYRIIGIRTTLPLHVQVMNSTRYQGGQFDTNFLEQRFTIDDSSQPDHLKVAAIAATLLAHQRNQQAILLQQRGSSPWKLVGRKRALRQPL
ncbi:MAG: acetyl-CoA carboxylase biotin carboxylase subunit [Anaerolineales bacterium]|nr:MAG: acetyl-CoA carboxylase biotin carboxylase subunit [Anaerolineales bacterium]